ncbi:hypothetical protein [Mucilaginibacter sp. RCC_168]
MPYPIKDVEKLQDDKGNIWLGADDDVYRLMEKPLKDFKGNEGQK